MWIVDGSHVYPHPDNPMFEPLSPNFKSSGSSLKEENMEAKEARLTAQEANKIANEKYLKDVDIIVGKVIEEAKKGKFTLTLFSSLHGLTQQGLEKLGYKVKMSSGRNETMTIIYW
jgi:hypothetical protein